MSIYKGEKLAAGRSVNTYLARRPDWNQAISISAEDCDAHISFVPYKAQ